MTASFTSHRESCYRGQKYRLANILAKVRQGQGATKNGRFIGNGRMNTQYSFDIATLLVSTILAFDISANDTALSHEVLKFVRMMLLLPRYTSSSQQRYTLSSTLSLKARRCATRLEDGAKGHTTKRKQFACSSVLSTKRYKCLLILWEAC